MEKLTFDSFTKKIYIKSTLEQLYWCWTTKAGIELWFLRNAEYNSTSGNMRRDNENVVAGDKYVWHWHNWEGRETGKILRANGTDFFEFSFANDICKVSVQLEQQDSAVLVTLIQYDMPTDEKTKMEVYNGCSCGWTFWLVNLKAYLEHDITLNEAEFDLTDVPQAGHIFVNM